jgi:hypothetical protein
MLTHVTHSLAELYKMVCDSKETDLDINIPAVLLPKQAGAVLQRYLTDGLGKYCLLFVTACEHVGPGHVLCSFLCLY